MRTNIRLDDDLVARAMRLTGIRTKRELVDVALTELVRRRERVSALTLKGRVRFAGGYDPKAASPVRP